MSTAVNLSQAAAKRLATQWHIYEHSSNFEPGLGTLTCKDARVLRDGTWSKLHSYFYVLTWTCSLVEMLELSGRQACDVFCWWPPHVSSVVVLFTMPTMAKLMLTRSRKVTVIPRKNMRHSTYLAAIRSVDEKNTLTVLIQHSTYHFKTMGVQHKTTRFLAHLVTAIKYSRVSKFAKIDVRDFDLSISPF